MCGIAGAFHFRRPDLPPDPALIERMTAAIAHRGPDGHGFHVRGPIALGHRRLAIIDLSTGAQPLSNEDGTVRITFNGEIYNYRPLRDRLLAAGHRFATASDTEVLVHLYEDLGPSFVRALDGMYAFALHDAARGVLLLARDPFGKKPLYYVETEEGILFASEIKALLAVCPRAIDTSALASYLTLGYGPRETTIFRGIRRVPPGHTLSIESPGHHGTGGRLSLRRHFLVPDFPERRSGIDFPEAVTTFGDLLDAAVRKRLMSEVPLGAFLSGGLDSAAIVESMVRAAREDGRAERVRTFTIGFPYPEYDETAPAAETARVLGTDHTVFTLAGDHVDEIDAILDGYDEPFCDASAIPTRFVCRETRRAVTVALSGDGGDEALLGYHRYATIESDPDGAFSRLAGRTLHRLASTFLPSTSRIRSGLRKLSLSPGNRYFERLSNLTADHLREVLTPHALARLDLAAARAEVADPFDARHDLSPAERASRSDLESYLPGDILTKVDIASMAVSLEVRVPFLDPALVRFTRSLPGSYLREGGRGKRLLRAHLAARLPRSLLDRPKTGFGLPLARWFRHELKDRFRTLFDRSDPPGGIFRRDPVMRFFREHQNGADHGFRLWTFLVLGRFLNRFS